MVKTKKKYDIVPFQLCPRCNGEGTIYKTIIDSYLTTSTYGPTTCNICNGSGVIPMALIPKKHETGRTVTTSG